LDNTIENDYDIIIAGGGMIGTCLALALAPLKLRVAVVEPVQRTNAEQPSFDDRSTALSRSTQRMFEAMRLWPEVVAASTPIKHIHVSDQGRFGFSHIDADEQKVEALGYVVINRVLGEVLQSRTGQVKDLDWMSPACITKARAEGETQFVTIEQDDLERELTCRLLVAADGANSSVRDMIGISAKKTDYKQMAVIGNLLPQKPMNNTAYERFTLEGPMAMLPVADDRAAFVWTLPPDMAREVLQLSDSEFTQKLHHAFGGRLGEFSKIGKRAAYPLSLSKANGLIGNRSVLVGNAAHGLHPVAAQGFNLGMRDVAALCDCLYDEQRDASQSDREFDPGSPVILNKFADWRRVDQSKVVHFTDNLVRLFASPRRPVAMLRNIGMLGFDLVPGVRRLFAKHTMGLAGTLPRLSRGVSLE
jgi:2-octaprenyl-6-methoxyphenol hydroxylase